MIVSSIINNKFKLSFSVTGNTYNQPKIQLSKGGCFLLLECVNSKKTILFVYRLFEYYIIHKVDINNIIKASKDIAAHL